MIPRIARPLAELKQGRTDWYRIENKKGGVEVLIYDEIGYFGVTAADFVKDIEGITADAFTLRINSPGGEVFDGMAIYNAVKNHPAQVTVQVDGLAASAASFIAMAGDTVTMTKNATMMIHDGNGFAVGNAQEMRKMADLLDKTSNNIASIYADKTGTPVETWRAAMLEETWYSAAEAVACGLADSIFETKDPTPENSWDLSIFSHAPVPPAPVPVNTAAVVEPPPEPPTDEEEVFTFDPETFKNAMDTAFEFDPGSFRTIISELANNAPATPTVTPLPSDRPESRSVSLSVFADALREALLS